MKLGSLFDGIGGFPLAGVWDGLIPVWASEIEPFPIKVTEKHFPGMKHLGDITKINGAEIEPVDVITFGSPCQDLSLAGKRAGIEGKRSGLFFEAIRVVREMRESTDGKYPRFAVWENVPGAFSSNDGQDFRSVLEELTESEIPMPKSGKWANAGMVRGNGRSAAWRCLDAQYFGVPQRRRRIFLVCDFAGQSAGEILFECEGVSGHPEESREAREEVAACVGDGVEGAIAFDGYNQTIGKVSQTIRADKTDGDHVGMVLTKGYRMTAFGEYADDDTASAMKARDYKDATDLVTPTACTVRRLTPTECERLQGYPPIKHSVVLDIENYDVEVSSCSDHQKTSVQSAEKKCRKLQKSVGNVEKIELKQFVQSVVENMNTSNLNNKKLAQLNVLINSEELLAQRKPLQDLMSNVHNAGKKQNDPLAAQIENFVQLIVGMSTMSEQIMLPGKEELLQKELHLITVKNGKIALSACGRELMQHVSVAEKDIHTIREHLKRITLSHSNIKHIELNLVTLFCYVTSVITGFTQNETLKKVIFEYELGWTDIPSASDTARYKALGNSVAVPCVEFVLSRISKVLREVSL